jgi:Acetyltransferase (GNAT) domain
MSSKLTTRYLTENEYGCWTNLVVQAPAGSIYSTPEYLDALCSAAGGKFRILAADRNGELVGGIGLYERESMWGRSAMGRLLLYYNGIVEKPHPSKYPSEQTARHNELLTALDDALATAGYGRVQLRNRSPFTDARVLLSRGWKALPTYSYVVPLTDIKAQWERVEQNLRRLVTRCGREGVTFTDDDDFESFFRMHEQTHTRKRIALYLSREQFERYFCRLHGQGLCRMFHARLPSGQSISAEIVLLGPHPITHTASAALDEEYMKMGATAFLRWKAFETLAALGYQGNDLTDATLNPVTHFKSQLGGDLQTCLMLIRPDSRGFRIERRLQSANTSARRLAKRALAPVLKRK